MIGLQGGSGYWRSSTTRTAQQSYSMIRRAVAGLLHDIIQPEVLTLVPELKNLVIFPHNDVVKLANTCVAERPLQGVPRMGQRVLRFALERLPELSTYYYGVLVNQSQQTSVGPNYACLVRLAAKLKDQKPSMPFSTPLLYTLTCQQKT